MSKIDELIVKLCPNGVEYKRLGELGILYTGLTGKSKDDFSDGNFRFISYKNVYDNIAVNLAYDNYVKIYDGEKQNNLVFGDILFTGSSETPEDVGMSSVVTTNMTEQIYLNSFCFGYRLNNKSLYLPDFLKYLFRSSIIRSNIIKCASGVTRFNISKKLFLKILVPVPPLEIQREIVKVLDTFTKLEAELEAELEARRRQYHYYRDQLLNFEGRDDVQWMTLGEVTKINTGQKPSNILEVATDFEYINAGTSRSGYCVASNCEGDTVTTPSRGQGGIGYVGYQKKTFWLGPLCYKLQSLDNDILINKYLFYVLQSKNELLLGLKKEGGVPAVNKSDIIKLEIPVPPLEEQTRIVTILDKFDALVNDLSCGLPAEIAARRKQYAYYRDRLLTFKEAQ